MRDSKYFIIIYSFVKYIYLVVFLNLQYYTALDLPSLLNMILEPGVDPTKLFFFVNMNFSVFRY